MIPILIFLSGMAAGVIADHRYDATKAFQIERLKQALEVKEHNDDWEFYEDQYGQLWATIDGQCMQVF